MFCTVVVATTPKATQTWCDIILIPGSLVHEDSRLITSFHGSFISGTASTLGRCDCLATKRKAKKGAAKKAKRTGKKKTKPKKQAPKRAPMLSPEPMPEVKPPPMTEAQPTTETPPAPEWTQPSESQSEPTPSQ